MKKKLLMSLFTIAIVGTLIGGGVMAWFSDTETTNPNVFTAGTLDLVLGQISTTPTDLSNMKPGDEVSGSITVQNIGSLDGWLYGRTTYSVSEWPNLANVLNVTSWTDPSGTYTPNMTLQGLVGQTHPITIPGYGGLWMPYGLLTAEGGGGTFAMTIEFDEDAGNDYQSSSIDVTFQFVLFQNNLS